MDAKERAAKISGLLKKNYPKSGIALRHDNPMQLLVAVILSAQCTDKRVNIVTGSLFKKYKTVNDFAKADLKIFEKEVRSTGFYRNKAKNITASAKMIKKDFNGRVPDNMEDMLKLPGVARKTANIVLSRAYGIIDGIAIDTHCIRLTQRWGLTRNRDAVRIEQDMMKLIPRRDWDRFSLMTIRHGRTVCHARKPNCAGCFLNKICQSAFKV